MQYLEKKPTPEAEAEAGAGAEEKNRNEARKAEVVKGSEAGEKKKE